MTEHEEFREYCRRWLAENRPAAPSFRLPLSPIEVINYIFSGGPAPNPLLSGDADCSGFVTISDPVYLINYVFSGGPAPCTGCP